MRKYFKVITIVTISFCMVVSIRRAIYVTNVIILFIIGTDVPNNLFVFIVKVMNM